MPYQTQENLVMTMRLDPRHVAGLALDAVASKFATTTETATIRRNFSRPRLVCRWQRTAEGKLTCSWGEVGQNEMDTSPWHIPSNQ
jgi:hypothetical protein